MVLAEALLRVPDAATADRLIEDKLAAGDWWRTDRAGPVPGLGLSLDAGHHSSHHSAGRDARQHPGKSGEAAWPARSARRDAPGHAAARLAFRARSDDRGGPQAGRRRARVSLLLRHAGRRRAHRRGRGEPFRILCRRDRRHRPSCREKSRCRTGRASRSSSRRSIRGTRQFLAIAFCANWYPGPWNWRAGPGATTSISPSMPRRPTGSNSRWRSFPAS